MPTPRPAPASARAGDLVFGNAVVHAGARQLLVNGAPARLGARAFDLLLALIERRERVVSKNELFEVVWPGLVVEENNLAVHISALRKWLGPHAITTIPGRGYRFTATLAGAARQTVAAPLEPVAAAAGPSPETPTALFGRDHDLASLPQRVMVHRLVTVTGTGGIGKTSIAQTVAHAMKASFTDGVWLVDLAPLDDAALLAGTLAEALHITLASSTAPNTSNDPADSLADALRARHMLIVLDNREHLVQPVAALTALLLRAAPKLHFLATSQEPLKLTDEHVYRLGTLALPSRPTLEAAREAGAVRLFEARAGAADLRFVLDADNVVAVVDIRTQLDSIGLAIELAAARVLLLGVQGLRVRLGQRLRLLGGGARTALPRHRTLRAALEWSHALLSPDQQAVFRRLGVMSGRFSLEATQQVAALGEIDEWAVLDHLSALVDKSLVVLDVENNNDSGEVRYRLLETMRHFALR